MEAWMKSDEKRLKSQSEVIGTGCQTPSCRHTEQKEHAQQPKCNSAT